MRSRGEEVHLDAGAVSSRLTAVQTHMMIVLSYKDQIETMPKV